MPGRFPALSKNAASVERPKSICQWRRLRLRQNCTPGLLTENTSRLRPLKIDMARTSSRPMTSEVCRAARASKSRGFNVESCFPLRDSMASSRSSVTSCHVDRTLSSHENETSGHSKPLMLFGGASALRFPRVLAAIDRAGHHSSDANNSDTLGYKHGPDTVQAHCSSDCKN